VKQFLSDVIVGELDYLIVDMPPGTGDVQLSLAQLVPVQGAVLVTTPQDVAIADVRRALRVRNGGHTNPGNC
jgi:ATP-binding protein involved in chromosome partitioning